MKDYRCIFEGIESTLIRVGSRTLPEAEIRANLDIYKQVEGKRCSDAEAYWILVEVAFYSGFRAATVTGKLEVLRRHFPDFQTVARYGENEVREILADPAMIKNRSKVRACVENARALSKIVREHGSFQAYVDSFSAKESRENLRRLKGELQRRFSYLGQVTVYHFLTEIGMPVLKPDRVICRIFSRLGLIDSEGAIEQAVDEGGRIAVATGHPMRYIDIVFVAYGQVQSLEFGLEKGICLSGSPSCGICGVKPYCNYPGRSGAPQDLLAAHALRGHCAETLRV